MIRREEDEWREKKKTGGGGPRKLTTGEWSSQVHVGGSHKKIQKSVLKNIIIKKKLLHGYTSNWHCS